MNNPDKIKNKIKNRIPAWLWYKYFYEKPVDDKSDKFNKVLFCVVKRKFS